MTTTQTILLVGGGLLQVFGFGLAAFGLSRTWAENADDEKLVARIWRDTVNFVWHKILRRRQVVGVSVGFAGGGQMRFSGSAYGYAPMPEDATPEQKFALLEETVHRALSVAHRAKSMGEELRADVTELETKLDKRIIDTRGQILDHVKRQNAADVPPAAVGLAAALIGTILQLVADLMA